MIDYDGKINICYNNIIQTIETKKNIWTYNYFVQYLKIQYSGIKDIGDLFYGFANYGKFKR